MDEESDPKKFIEQLTGKLGQSLRKYNGQQSQPDYELEKFAINSLLSATHVSEMDPEDQNDIIKKVKESGTNDDEERNDGIEQDTEKDIDIDNSEVDVDVDERQIVEDDNIFLKDVPKNNMFQPHSNDILNDKSLSESKKSSIFDKNQIKQMLKETLNQDDTATAEPLLEPITKPTPTKPAELPIVTPSRRNKPFLPMPNTQPDPKASK